MVLTAVGPTTLTALYQLDDARGAEPKEVPEVIQFVLGAFMVAHGLLTAFIWVSPAKADAPFRATHSWLVGDTRPVAVVIALVAAAGFVLAGIGFITHQAWWAITGIGAGAVALLLMTLYFNLWLLAGIAISAGILYAGIQALPQA
jgi:hypothetical protein